MRCDGTARRYREAIAEASELDPLALRYYRFDADAALERLDRSCPKSRKWKEGVLEKASRGDSMRAF